MFLFEMTLWEKISYWLNQTSADWMPRAICVMGNPIVIGLNITGELLRGLAYYSIPIILWYVARKKSEFFNEYGQILRLFGAFIILCGTTHLIGIVMFWSPIYWIDGGLKVVTAIVSLFTAYVLYKALPKILSLPTTSELNKVLEEKLYAEKKVVQLEERLEAWNTNVGMHVEGLKAEHERIRKRLVE